MRINSFGLKPFPETIAKTEGSIFFAAVKGVNIVELNEEGIHILYAEEAENLWEAFHFSILFRESIFFFPRNYEYVIKYDITRKSAAKLAIPEKQKGECMIPCVKDNALIMIGLGSGNIYRCVDGIKFEKIMRLDWEDKQWKIRKQDVQMDNMLFWNSDQGEIAVFDKKLLALEKMLATATDIIYATGDEKNLYWITKSGDVYFKNSEADTPDCLLHLEHPDSVCVIYREHRAYLLPRTGNEIYVIGENLKVSRFCLEMDLREKVLYWTVFEDGFIGVAEDKEIPWNGEVILFTFDLHSYNITEIPFARAVAKYLFGKNLDAGIFLHETTKIGLREYLEFIRES